MWSQAVGWVWAVSMRTQRRTLAESSGSQSELSRICGSAYAPGAISAPQGAHPHGCWGLRRAQRIPRAIPDSQWASGWREDHHPQRAPCLSELTVPGRLSIFGFQVLPCPMPVDRFLRRMEDLEMLASPSSGCGLNLAVRNLRHVT